MSIDYSTGEITEPLTDNEAARLRHKERVIERSAGEVAQALAAIRDERLYREEHSTFDAYCRERWGMSRTHADRQIVAAEVVEALAPIGVRVPESQARELADLRDDPEKLRETYRRASDATDGNVTAAAIREARGRAPQTDAPSSLPAPGSAGDDSAGRQQQEPVERSTPAANAPEGGVPAAPRPPVTGIARMRGAGVRRVGDVPWDTSGPSAA